MRRSSTDPEGRQAFAAMYELTLARDGESHTDTKVVPSKERGHGVSLAGGPGTAIAFRRKLGQPLTSRGAVGGPPRKAVWRMHTCGGSIDCCLSSNCRACGEKSTQLNGQL